MPALSQLGAQETKTVPAGIPVTITVTQATPAAPDVSITLNARHGHVNPHRSGCTHTGGGNIDVSQPSADTVVVTMSGVAVAYCTPKGASAALHFDLDQCFDIAIDNPKVKKAKLTIEGRVIGLLRSHSKGGGTAEYSDATACIGVGGAEIVTLHVAPHGVACGESLSLNDREGPITVPVSPGKYTLKQTFAISAQAPKTLLPCKAPSAEFADGALDPLWISSKEPFKGAAKKDFGFQVTIKVAAE